MNLRREKCFEIQFCCDLITFEKQKQRGEERRNRKLTFLLFFKFRAKFKNGGKKLCRKISQREKFWRQKISDVALNFEFLKKTICILKNF